MRRRTTAALLTAGLLLGSAGPALATTVGSISVTDPTGDWSSDSSNGETTAQKASIDLGKLTFARVRVAGRNYLRTVAHLRNVASYPGVAQSVRSTILPTLNGKALIMSSDRAYKVEVQKYTNSGGYTDVACPSATQTYDNSANTITIRVPFSCVPSGFRTSVYGYADSVTFRAGNLGSDDFTDFTKNKLDLS